MYRTSVSRTTRRGNAARPDKRIRRQDGQSKSTHRGTHTSAGSQDPPNCSESGETADTASAVPPIKPSKLEARFLNQLRPFPQQASYFEPLSDHDINALARDILRNGLRQPIEILPENAAGLPPDTILRGHERRRALLWAGETRRKVLVRYDLADADIATIEREFLEDNQNRRHLDPLARARVALRLFGIERSRSRNRGAGEDAEARDRVGKAIGMSGRNLVRYMRLLRTPREVQDAFRNGDLSLVVAEKVADQEPEHQEEIAHRIREGEKPKTVLASCLPSKKAKQTQPSDQMKTFVTALRRQVTTLQPQLKRIRAADVKGCVPDLRRANQLLERLLRLAEE